ncbi:hypothetical protein HUT16_27530 [Kitasatospora sp. NA04385]|uniref:hypothetical protein n=1 Tax=Kitasatospora sp. NA04385 TaxID=2742135 RepID=UPI00159002C6|nr:hypothetical protein [Kitasatospora sp. NA04385]QKW22332.1 hypothetical protein HUT16_27530 [Kitasatospora sp. NA04385]
MKAGILTDEQARAVLATAQTLGPADEALAQLAINAGLRMAEIAALSAGNLTRHEPADARSLRPAAASTDLASNAPEYDVQIRQGKAPRTIRVIEPVARALEPWMLLRPEEEPLFPEAATVVHALDSWHFILDRAGVIPAADEDFNQAGRNRLLAYLLGLEEKGILPNGYAGSYLGLPGTAYDDLPAGWQDEVARAILNGPTGAVGDLSAAETPTD